MINWVLQKNLTKPDDLNRIKSAVIDDGESFDEIEIVPFSIELPKLDKPHAFNLPYGSTTFMLNAYVDKEYRNGVFYDPDKFRVSNYVEKWGSHTLNYSGELIKFGDLLNYKSNESGNWFLRPDHDGKEFSGRVDTFKNLKDWCNKIINLNLEDFNKETEIWISEPIEIRKEWRAFIVDDEIASVCRYLLGGELNESSEDIPGPMIRFLEERILEYRLDDVYVMDIAEIESGFKIIECNCFNGTGFYDHNIEEIVFSINEFLRRKIKNEVEQA